MLLGHLQNETAEEPKEELEGRRLGELERELNGRRVLLLEKGQRRQNYSIGYTLTLSEEVSEMPALESCPVI